MVHVTFTIAFWWSCSLIFSLFWICHDALSVFACCLDSVSLFLFTSSDRLLYVSFANRQESKSASRVCPFSTWTLWNVLKVYFILLISSLSNFTLDVSRIFLKSGHLCLHSSIIPVFVNPSTTASLLANYVSATGNPIRMSMTRLILEPKLRLSLVQELMASLIILQIILHNIFETHLTFSLQTPTLQ